MDLLTEVAYRKVEMLRGSPAAAPGYTDGLSCKNICPGLNQDSRKMPVSTLDSAMGYPDKVAQIAVIPCSGNFSLKH